jgi:hypothetical protein
LSLEAGNPGKYLGVKLINSDVSILADPYNYASSEGYHLTNHYWLSAPANHGQGNRF